MEAMNLYRSIFFIFKNIKILIYSLLIRNGIQTLLFINSYLKLILFYFIITTHLFFKYRDSKLEHKTKIYSNRYKHYFYRLTVDF